MNVYERVQDRELKWQSQKLQLQFQDCSTLLQNVTYFVSIRGILPLSSVHKFYFEYMRFDIASIPMKQGKVVRLWNFNIAYMPEIHSCLNTFWR